MLFIDLGQRYKIHFRFEVQQIKDITC